MTLQRRDFLAATGALALGASPLARAAQPERVKVKVWKDPGCGCCKEWVKHLQAHGFDVLAHDVDGPADVRARLGMPDTYGSCHTARVGGPGGYLLEGHVPAREVRRLLAEKPKPSDEDIDGAMAGNICRCGAYQRIRAAIKDVAEGGAR